MSYISSSDSKTELVFEANKDSSSVEPPMSEWSSISIKIGEENLKKRQYEQGLFDVGSGEICAAYSPLSGSEVLSHPYYFYPCTPDPGILSALFEPPPNIIYPSDGQEYYLAICKDMQQCPVRIFHRGLLETRINMSYYGVNPKGVRAMAMALEKNSYVTCLNLTDNWLDFDACFHLGQMLEKNSTLAELIMYGCRIGSRGTRGLCRGLTKNKTLRLLDLGSNQIGDEGLGHLSDLILLMSDIRELNLSHNEITGKGCKHLAEALEIQNKLTYLNLSHNNLYSFPSGLCAVLQLLGTNPEFEYLNLSWNSLRGQEVAYAVKSVFNAKLLRHVDLSNNKLNGRDIVTLTGLFAKPKEMMFFDLSFNPLSLVDALLVIQKFKCSKIRTLNLEGVNVDKQFLDELTITLEKRKDVIVTYGYVQGGFKPKGPDAREIVLNRIEFIGKKNKYRQMDIAVVILKLLKDKFFSIGTKELSDTIRMYGVFLDEDLLNAIQVLWPGEPREKGGKTICLKALAEYIKRKWPERQLPPTPPPEVELVPVNPKKRNEKKERKLDGSTHPCETAQCGGGVARNMAEALWRLSGGRARLLTAVGDDSDGRYLSQIAPGLLLDGCVVRGARTATYAALMDARGECRLGLGDMALHNHISIELVNRHMDVLESAPIVVLDGNAPQSTIDYVIQHCSRINKPVFYEPTDRRKATKVLRSGLRIAYASPNLNELRAMAQHIKSYKLPDHVNDVDEILHLSKILSSFVECLIVTIGAKGVIIVRNMDDSLKAKHYSVDTVENIENVSGAGDCFASGFLHGVLSNMNEASCVSIGFNAARCALRSPKTVPSNFDNSTYIKESSYKILQ